MSEPVLDVVYPSDSVSHGGYWSGAENKHHVHYIALIPESRYIDQSEILQLAIEACRQFTAPKPYVPKVYPNPLVEAPAKPLRSKPKYTGWVPPRFGTVRINGVEFPIHMSGWPTAQLEAWLKADGHKDLEAAIIALHERGA